MAVSNEEPLVGIISSLQTLNNRETVTIDVDTNLISFSAPHDKFTGVALGKLEIGEKVQITVNTAGFINVLRMKGNQPIPAGGGPGPGKSGMMMGMKGSKGRMGMMKAESSSSSSEDEPRPSPSPVP